MNAFVESAVANRHQVTSNPAWHGLVGSKSVLLLQGPVGPFFDRLADALRARGSNVQRIAFHGGDLWDCKTGPALPFQGSVDDWPAFFKNVLKFQQVDGVVLFGQSRVYHQVAIQICELRGIPCYVLEEGYFRPGYATIEFNGVNARSSTLQVFDWQGIPPQPHQSKHVFFRTAVYAMAHYLAMTFHKAKFPHYSHHRPTSVFFYSYWWVAGWLRWRACFFSDRLVLKQMLQSRTPFFFVPLQFHEDSQIKLFSPYPCNYSFLSEVVRSFAENADPHHVLVIKQHPHARGSGEVRSQLKELAKGFGVSQRIVFLVEGSVSVLVKQSQGVVTVNSTTGLMALRAGVPLHTMGQSVYQNAPGVDQGPLDSFWANPRRHLSPDSNSFVTALIGLTQIPQDLYASRASAIRL